MARPWLSSGGGVRQNGQSFTPRLQAAKMQPSHTSFMQHIRKVDCIHSSGKGRLQMGHSSSSGLVRPFVMSTSCIPASTHSSHLLLLCLNPRCSSLNESSGSVRSHAPQSWLSTTPLSPLMSTTSPALPLLPYASASITRWRVRAMPSLERCRSTETERRRGHRRPQSRPQVPALRSIGRG